MKILRDTKLAVNVSDNELTLGQGPCPGKDTADNQIPVLHSLSEGQRDKKPISRFR